MGQQVPVSSRLVVFDIDLVESLQYTKNERYTGVFTCYFFIKDGAMRFWFSTIIFLNPQFSPSVSLVFFS